MTALTQRKEIDRITSDTDAPKRRAVDAGAPDDQTGLRAEYRALLYDQRRANSTFSRFVPQELLDLLGAKSITALRRGDHTEKKIATMFCDLRDFTTLSEDLPSGEVFDLINAFTSYMEPPVQSHHGVIDKFIGDSIMALFPREIDDALRAAISMQSAMEKFNEWRASANNKPLSMSIGLNAGIVTLGIIGHLERLEMTVLGDAINVASRIESAAKRLGLRIVISDSVLAGLKDPNDYSIRFVDRIRLKGRSNPVTLYEVFDSDTPQLAKAKLRSLEVFERAVALYHMKRPREAYPLIIECLSKAPLDVVAQYYARRCEAFIDQGIYDGTDELSETREWTPEYNTNVALVDDQHHTLFDNIKKLSHAITTGDRQEVEEVFAFIENYASRHFADEEALMMKFGYPLAEQHRAEHRAFGKAFARRRAEILSGRHDEVHATFQINLFLTDWLINHSTKTDKHLTKYILEQVGKDPTRSAEAGVHA